MSRKALRAAVVLLLPLASIVVGGPVPSTTAAGAQPLLDLTQHVNPFIGTDDSNSPNPVPGGAGGSTFPGPALPFGMVQFSPDTPTGSPSGYRYSDTSVQEFSLTHFNGAGCPNNEDIGLLPSSATSARPPARAGPAMPAPTARSTRPRSPATTAPGSTTTAPTSS